MSEEKKVAAPKLQKSEPLEEGTIVKLKDLDKNGEPTGKEMMWVEGTGASVHMGKGVKFHVNELHGEKLISKGAAIETTAPKVAAKKVAVK